MNEHINQIIEAQQRIIELANQMGEFNRTTTTSGYKVRKNTIEELREILNNLEEVNEAIEKY